MLVMLDQVAQDSGDYSLGWLLTLQADPPAGLFQKPAALPGSSLQSFSPLAEQRWVTTSLAYVKELESISQRRAEAHPKKPPHKPALPTPPTTPAEETPTRKQQRAAAWAAKKAAAAAAAATAKK